MMARLGLLLVVMFATGGITVVGHSSSGVRALEIYYVDVEGGAATLIVTPAGESVLIDAGFPGFDGRDARRIKQAMEKAGIAAIDHMVATHYHRDHFGGIPELARLVTIKRFYDHGRMSSLDEDKNFPELYAAYQSATRGRSTTLKPGDTIPLRRAAGTPVIRLLCVASAREVIGGKSSQNPECGSLSQKDEDATDNARSVALLLTYGDFQFLDCGDLTWNVEARLVCPSNRVGAIDLYQVTHHGLNISNNPVLLRSAKPTVAIMNNGPRKGGNADTVKWLREIPSLKALYQVHRNVVTKTDENTPEELIANLDENEADANLITVAVKPADHVFSVTNGRTGETRRYPIK
ncbi:MAG TPA: MBL fold metallo-hydrolase [Blastocatellia bacterium]|nr:MBL fold metallo-hydrolase [Blastocatellia bacterium]